jgi:hypothetical protein
VGLDLRKHYIKRFAGQYFVRDAIAHQGFQILIAYPINDGLPKPMLYWVKDYGRGYGACIQLGWKIKMDYNAEEKRTEIDNFVGLTIEINPYKELKRG